MFGYICYFVAVSYLLYVIGYAFKSTARAKREALAGSDASAQTCS